MTTPCSPVVVKGSRHALCLIFRQHPVCDTQTSGAVMLINWLCPSWEVRRGRSRPHCELFELRNWVEDGVNNRKQLWPSKYGVKCWFLAVGHAAFELQAKIRFYVGLTDAKHSYHERLSLLLIDFESFRNGQFCLYKYELWSLWRV